MLLCLLLNTNNNNTKMHIMTDAYWDLFETILLPDVILQI